MMQHGNLNVRLGLGWTPVDGKRWTGVDEEYDTVECSHPGWGAAGPLSRAMIHPGSRVMCEHCPYLKFNDPKMTCENSKGRVR